MHRIRDVIIGVIFDLSFNLKWEKAYVFNLIKRNLCQKIQLLQDQVKVQVQDRLDYGTSHLYQVKQPVKFLLSSAINNSLATMRDYADDDLKVIFLFTNQYNSKYKFHYEKLFKQNLDLGLGIRVFVICLNHNFIDLYNFNEHFGKTFLVKNEKELDEALFLAFEEINGNENSDEI
jgi:hypothetical protein